MRQIKIEPVLACNSTMKPEQEAGSRESSQLCEASVNGGSNPTTHPGHLNRVICRTIDGAAVPLPSGQQLHSTPSFSPRNPRLRLRGWRARIQASQVSHSDIIKSSEAESAGHGTPASVTAFSNGAAPPSAPPPGHGSAWAATPLTSLPPPLAAASPLGARAPAMRAA